MKTSSYAQIFPLPQVFWNIEGFSHRCFGTRRQKIFDEKTWNPPFFMHNFGSIIENLCNTEGNTADFFGSRGTKNFQ